MDKLHRFLSRFAKDKKSAAERRRVVTALALVVVLAVVNSLILPAITVDSSSVPEGMVLEGAPSDEGEAVTKGTADEEAPAEETKATAEAPAEETKAAAEAPAEETKAAAEAPAEETNAAAETPVETETAAEPGGVLSLPAALPSDDAATAEFDTDSFSSCDFAAGYVYNVDGIGDTSAVINSAFDMMKGVTLRVTDAGGTTVSSAVDGQDYYKVTAAKSDDEGNESTVTYYARVAVTSVTRSKDGVTDSSYTWDGTASFKAPEDSGYNYAVTYQVQLSDDAGNWTAAADSDRNPLNFTRNVSIITKTEVRDFLTADDEYISGCSVEAAATGTAPFDSDDASGNDSSPANTIVRSFDSITYTLQLSSAAYTDGIYYEKGHVWFKFVLPYSKNEAAFDTDSMGWICTETGYEAYQTTETLTIGGEEKTCQVLYAARALTANDEQDNAFPVANMTVNLAVNVLAMPNGATVTPVGYTWMDYNLDSTEGHNGSNNPKNWTDAARAALSEDTVCSDHKESTRTGGKEVHKFAFTPVTVSAAPSYDIILHHGTTDRKTATYDFSTGGAKRYGEGTSQTVGQNFDKGSVYGQADRYGITIALYNTDTNKGLRGIELPTGDITFDITFSQTYRTDNGTRYDITGEYAPLLWSLNGAATEGKTNYRNGRTLDGVETRKYPSHTTVYNSIEEAGGRADNYGNRAYDGGSWSATQDGSTIHVTVSDYRIDPSFLPSAMIDGSAGTSVMSPSGNYWSETFYYPANKDGLAKTYIGAFSSGSLELIHPFVHSSGSSAGSYLEDETYLANKYGSGTVRSAIKDVNLRATSVSNQTQADEEDTNSAQASKGNDSLTSTVYVSRPGTYDNIIRYTNPKGDYYSDFNGLNHLTYGNCVSNGKDVAQIGQSGTIMWGGISGIDGFDQNLMVAINSLLKFDPDLISITGTPKLNGSYLETGVNATYLYAAKRDGTSWTGFEEMNSAKEEDLVYYASLSDLQASGKTCVGILMEARTDSPSGTTDHSQIQSTVPVKVTGDYDKAGEVAAITETSDVWKKGTNGLLGSSVPLRTYDNSTNTYVISSDLPAPSVDNCRLGQYQKAAYDDAGHYTGGHAGSSNIGDSLYITPYKAEIDKFVAQYATGSTGEKTNFDLDNDQTTVDFRLEPHIYALAETTAGSQTTTVYVADLLPDGVTYTKGSSYYGNGYEQSATPGYHGSLEAAVENNSAKKLDDPETVTVWVSAGQSYSGSGITVSGTEVSGYERKTALVWKFENVPVNNTDYFKGNYIYYSAEIDKLAAVNNQQFVNESWIYTSDINSGSYSTGNGNYSTKGFKVTKNASVSLLKKSPRTYYDAGNDVSYTLTWQNTSQNETNTYAMVDVLPSKGSNNSSYRGAYSMTGLRFILPDGSESGKYKAWYTTSREVNSGNFKNTDITGDTTGTWSEFKLTSSQDENGHTVMTAAMPDLSDGQTVTAWAITGPIPAGGIVQADLTVKLGTDNRSEDRFVNQIAYGNGRGTSTIYIVDRRLSGVTWIDADKDGYRDSNEKMLPGVQVTLYKAGSDGAVLTEPYTNLAGEKCETRTDRNGRYEFTRLEEGSYVVTFTDPSTGKVLENRYFLTKQNDTTDPDRNSKAALVSRNSKDGTTTRAQITGITMPAAGQITSSPYTLEHQDAGFFTSAPAAIDVPLSVRKMLVQNNGSGSYTDITSDKAKLTEGRYSFSLSDNNTPGAAGSSYDLPDSLKAANSSNSDNTAYDNVSFGNLKIYKAGTYSFRIAEDAISKGDPSYTQDNGTVIATVTATEISNPNAKTEQERFENPTILQAAVSYKSYDSENKERSNRALGNVSVSESAFANIYTSPTPATVRFEANKSLAGKALESEEFSFHLTADNGNTAGGYTLNDGAAFTTQTAKNDAEGKVTFPAIKFMEEGTYRFTISEEKSDTAKYTYDDDISVTVTVTKDSQNRLNAAVRYSKGTAADSNAALTFQNTLITQNLLIRKQDAATGAALSGAEFTLTTGEPAANATAASGISDGKITVGSDGTAEIKGLPAGTYTLTETKAPDGYVILKTGITITVSSAGVKMGNTNLTTQTGTGQAVCYVVTVSNTPGAALPDTGGPGTGLFRILGAVLAAGALLGLFCVMRTRRPL